VSLFSPDELMAAWSFSWAFKREEVIAAFEHRLERIAASARATEYAIEDVARDPEKPPHIAEHWRLAQARLDGEAQWLTSVLEGLRAGEYWFAEEPDPPFTTHAGFGRR